MEEREEGERRRTRRGERSIREGGTREGEREEGEGGDGAARGE